MPLTKIASRRGAVPIGGIIPHYNFGIAGLFDIDTWKYCNGTTIVDANSPLNGQTMPDLSNRYLVGFGTELNGVPQGDIGTDPWATAAVGNYIALPGGLNHQINLQHPHSGPNHSHGLTSGFVKWHTNSAFSAVASMSNPTSWNYNFHMQTDTYSAPNGDIVPANSSGTVAVSAAVIALGGTTDNGGTGNTGNALSATQSIQPRSIRVRFIMRIK